MKALIKGCGGTVVVICEKYNTPMVYENGEYIPIDSFFSKEELELISNGDAHEVDWY